jgi:hypothetical protein
MHGPDGGLTKFVAATPIRLHENTSFELSDFVELIAIILICKRRSHQTSTH